MEASTRIWLKLTPYSLLGISVAVMQLDSLLKVQGDISDFLNAE